MMSSSFFSSSRSHRAFLFLRFDRPLLLRVLLLYNHPFPGRGTIAFPVESLRAFPPRVSISLTHRRRHPRQRRNRSVLFGNIAFAWNLSISRTRFSFVFLLFFVSLQSSFLCGEEVRKKDFTTFKRRRRSHQEEDDEQVKKRERNTEQLCSSSSPRLSLLSLHCSLSLI